nr:MAG TPA: hypothetical protein [Caudoviricetes sp.]
MGIVRYNRPISLSNYSITEASYIIDSYIEESFNDLQIKCLMVDNRSLQESGVRYFTEENEAGQKKILDRIKEIFSTVWNSIVNIFDKIKDFFTTLIANIMVKSANPKNKEIVEKASDSDIHFIVSKNVDTYYNLDKYEKSLDTLVKETKDNFKGEYTQVPTKSDIKYSQFKVDEIASVITKSVLLTSAFGGFRDQFKQIQSTFNSVKNAFKKIENKSDNATAEIFRGKFVEWSMLKSVESSLRTINYFSMDYSKMIIHNAKMLVKVVNTIVKDSNKKKDKTTNESVSLDFVF